MTRKARQEMLDFMVVMRFFRILEGSELDYEFRYDDGQRNERINRAAFPLLAAYPELAHTRLSDFVSDSSTDTPLHLAAFYLNLELVRRLIAVGADVNANEGGDSVPLSKAISVQLSSTEAYQQAKMRTIELLLEFGADPNRKNDIGETPLHEAMRCSNDAVYVTIVGLLLRYGADPNAMSSTGWAPIHIWQCDLEALDLMVAHGADINLPDKDGDTPLMLSFAQGCGDVAVLLKYGADVNARNKKRMTALHHFAMGEGFEDDLPLLLQAGSKVDARDSRGYTPLHYAACYGQLSNVRLLLSAGADLHARSHLQETPLAVVKMGKSLAGAEPYEEAPCSETEYKAMEALLEEMGAEVVEVKSTQRRSKAQVVPTAKSETRVEALERAAIQARAEIEADALVGQQDYQNCSATWLGNPLPDSMLQLFYQGNSAGWAGVQALLTAHPGLARVRFRNLYTPLHFAAQAQHLYLVKQCIALGADVNLREDRGSTPLMFALHGADCVFRKGKHRTEVIETLLKAGADPNRGDEYTVPLTLAGNGASSLSFLPILRMLLNAGADPNRQNYAGWSPMHNLCKIPAALPLLVEHGGNVNDVTSEGDTPLLFCTTSENAVDAIRTLLQLGAKIDHRNRKGHTALHYAAMILPSGDRLVQALLEGGANPNLKDRRGYTPLHYAVSGCALASIRLLLTAGADIHAANRKGETPLAIAEKGAHIRNVLFEYDSPPVANAYAETAAFLRQAGAQK